MLLDPVITNPKKQEQLGERGKNNYPLSHEMMWLKMFPPEANIETSLGTSFSESVLSDHFINFSRSHVTSVSISSQWFVHAGVF